jgi:hypothetical protein
MIAGSWPYQIKFENSNKIPVSNGLGRTGELPVGKACRISVILNHGLVYFNH